jgi:predicted ATPase/DNA-binding CsgD family transcriptional regulator
VQPPRSPFLLSYVGDVAPSPVDLTARERAVLHAVERRLGNGDIAAEMHISVRTVESHIASLRRKLGVDSRAGLIEKARLRRGSTVAVPQNSFVGREGDLAAVRGLLQMERFVTVVGPAGSGKTRLALELAASDDRVPVVVALEHAAADDVVRVVANAVGMGSDATGDPVGATGLALAAQSYLLVLDNCDRVSGPVSSLVAELLVMAGSLRVVATSRAPLGGPAEAVYPLAPLSTDGPGSAAARLFLDRARSAAPASPMSDADTKVVERVCERLDGLPLALELAAARVRHLSVTELADRLDEGFGALDRAAPDGRHRTLQSAFAWTWDLLDAEEQTVLVRLAALPRTFDLDLAEAVAGPGAAEVTLRLLDRSLVAPAAKACDIMRFRLLESLRAFVLEQADAATVRQVRDAHAEYHRAMAQSFAAVARTDDSGDASAKAKLLCPEVNAAVEWSLDHRPELAVSLARTLAIGGEQYGPDLASLQSIARTARHPVARSIATSEDLFELGMATTYLDLDLMGDIAQLCAGRGAGGPRDELLAEHLSGHAAAYRHEPTTALAHLARAEELAGEQRDMWHLAHVRQARGIAYRDLGDYQAAMASFESAMQTYGLAGDAMHVNNSRYMMAAEAVRAGRPVEQAVAWAEECVAYSLRSGNRHEYAHAVLTRANLVARQTAEGDLQEAVEIFRTVGDLRCLTRSFLRLADEQPPQPRAAWLGQALDVATRARDRDDQAVALERLVGAHWEAGAGQEAASAFGALCQLVGEDEAALRCPADLVAAAADWPMAVAQGRGRFLAPA